VGEKRRNELIRALRPITANKEQARRNFSGVVPKNTAKRFMSTPSTRAVPEYFRGEVAEDLKRVITERQRRWSGSEGNEISLRPTRFRKHCFKLFQFESRQARARPVCRVGQLVSKPEPGLNQGVLELSKDALSWLRRT
jgi:hypothetical protein